MVDIASAKYMSEYQGQFYYFCAAGCKATFDKNPQEHSSIPAAEAQ
jgi:YHS domain-containing protein